jgi:hypothetical protein
MTLALTMTPADLDLEAIEWTIGEVLPGLVTTDAVRASARSPLGDHLVRISDTEYVLAESDDEDAAARACAPLASETELAEMRQAWLDSVLPGSWSTSERFTVGCMDVLRLSAV